jgi:hypothetical protein
MRSRRLVTFAAAVALTGGCGDAGTPPVSTACTDEARTITRALAAAPGAVKLADGSTISACLEHARTESELQNVGAALTNAAEDLELGALHGDRDAALQLGYLVGAARRGAAKTGGVSEELVYRLERSAAVSSDVPGIAAAIERGVAAGAQRG